MAAPGSRSMSEYAVDESASKESIASRPGSSFDLDRSTGNLLKERSENPPDIPYPVSDNHARSASSGTGTGTGTTRTATTTPMTTPLSPKASLTAQFTSASASTNVMPSPPPSHLYRPIKPQPAYVAPSAASHLLYTELVDPSSGHWLGRDGRNNNPPHHFASPSHEDEAWSRDETRPTIVVVGLTIAPSALRLINAFLDQLLFNFLAGARSTSLVALRPAIADLLKPRLAKEAIEGADDELRGYLAGGDDEELLDFHHHHQTHTHDVLHARSQGEDSTHAHAHASLYKDSCTAMDLQRMFRRTRLRCMVYTRLGDLEEEDEDVFLAEEEEETRQIELKQSHQQDATSLEQGKESGADGQNSSKVETRSELAINRHRLSQDLGSVSPAAAIFLTSIIEYLAEQILLTAGENAYSRCIAARRSSLTSVATSSSTIADPGTSPSTINIILEDRDVEKVAFNKTLGRLWRSWRRRPSIAGTSAAIGAASIMSMSSIALASASAFSAEGTSQRTSRAGTRSSSIGSRDPDRDRDPRMLSYSARGSRAPSICDSQRDGFGELVPHSTGFGLATGPGTTSDDIVSGGRGANGEKRFTPDIDSLRVIQDGHDSNVMAKVPQWPSFQPHIINSFLTNWDKSQSRFRRAQSMINLSQSWDSRLNDDDDDHAKSIIQDESEVKAVVHADAKSSPSEKGDGSDMPSKHVTSRAPDSVSSTIRHLQVANDAHREVVTLPPFSKAATRSDAQGSRSILPLRYRSQSLPSPINHADQSCDAISQNEVRESQREGDAAQLNSSTAINQVTDASHQETTPNDPHTLILSQAPTDSFTSPSDEGFTTPSEERDRSSFEGVDGEETPVPLDFADSQSKVTGRILGGLSTQNQRQGQVDADETVPPNTDIAHYGTTRTIMPVQSAPSDVVDNSSHRLVTAQKTQKQLQQQSPGTSKVSSSHQSRSQATTATDQHTHSTNAHIPQDREMPKTLHMASSSPHDGNAEHERAVFDTTHAEENKSRASTISSKMDFQVGVQSPLGSSTDLVSDEGALPETSLSHAARTKGARHGPESSASRLDGYRLGHEASAVNIDNADGQAHNSASALVRAADGGDDEDGNSSDDSADYDLTDARSGPSQIRTQNHIMSKDSQKLNENSSQSRPEASRYQRNRYESPSSQSQGETTNTNDVNDIERSSSMTPTTSRQDFALAPSGSNVPSNETHMVSHSEFDQPPPKSPLRRHPESDFSGIMSSKTNQKTPKANDNLESFAPSSLPDGEHRYQTPPPPPLPVAGTERAAVQRVSPISTSSRDTSARYGSPISSSSPSSSRDFARDFTRPIGTGPSVRDERGTANRSSPSRDPRPFTSGSPASVGSKFKGMISPGRSSGEQNRLQSYSSIGNESNRTGRSSSDKDNRDSPAGVLGPRKGSKEQDFEQLIRSDETIQYTLTPQNMREMERTSMSTLDGNQEAIGIKNLNSSNLAGDRSSGPSQDRSLTSPRSLRSLKGLNGLRSNPTASGAHVNAPTSVSTQQLTQSPSQSTSLYGKSLPEPPGQTLRDRDRNGTVDLDVDRDDSLTTMKKRLAPAAPNRSKSIAREAANHEVSTRDFADFIRSTGPRDTINRPSIAPVSARPSKGSSMQPRSASDSSASNQNHKFSSSIGSGKKFGIQSTASINLGGRDRDRDANNMMARTANPRVAPSSRSVGKLMARDPIHSPTNTTSELVDFLRSGGPADKPRAVSGRGSGISSSMSPGGRSSTEASNGRNGGNGRARNDLVSSASQESYAGSKMTQSSTNSQTGLLESTNRQNRQDGWRTQHDHHHPREPESSRGGGAERKQRRNKDPYALDSDSDGDDDIDGKIGARADIDASAHGLDDADHGESLADLLREVSGPVPSANAAINRPKASKLSTTTKSPTHHQVLSTVPANAHDERKFGSVSIPSSTSMRDRLTQDIGDAPGQQAPLPRSANVGRGGVSAASQHASSSSSSSPSAAGSRHGKPATYSIAPPTTSSRARTASQTYTTTHANNDGTLSSAKPSSTLTSNSHTARAPQLPPLTTTMDKSLSLASPGSGSGSGPSSNPARMAPSTSTSTSTKTTTSINHMNMRDSPRLATEPSRSRQQLVARDEGPTRTRGTSGMADLADFLRETEPPKAAMPASSTSASAFTSQDLDRAGMKQSGSSTGFGGLFGRKKRVVV